LEFRLDSQLIELFRLLGTPPWMHIHPAVIIE